MTFHFIDWNVLAVYVIVIMYIGFYLSAAKKSGSETEDFILAGRKLTLPLFVGTLVATWYGSILGVGEFVYRDGLVAFVCFGFPYYIAAALFAWFLAGKVREANVLTIPEQIETKFGKKASWISAIIVLILTIPAAYFLMLGVLLNMFLNISLWVSIVIGAVISLAYLFTGGFKADVMTNSAQFVFMYLGFGALIYFSIDTFGSPSEMIVQLPDSHKKVFGDLNWQYVLAWYIIAFQTFVDPSFHQRCSAAKTPEIAKKGILISIGFWAIFDILTLLAGLYARVNFQIDDPLMAFPVLGENILPVFWKGIFVVAMLAAVMSTLDSYAFLSAATIGNDIIKPLLKKFTKYGHISTKLLAKYGLLVTGILGVSLAIILPSAIDLIYKTSSIAVPGILLPLTISYSSKIKLNPNNALIIMIVSSSVSFFWTVIQELNVFFDSDILNTISAYEPMIPGILISIVLSLLFIKKI